MEPVRENVLLPQGQSFRLLRWEQSVEQVECVLAPRRAVPLTGQGAHWHFHPEMELTLFTKGQGMRFVGDHIAEFQTGDLVFLGKNLPHYWHAEGECAGLSLQWNFPPTHPFWAFPEMGCQRELFAKADCGLHLTGRSGQQISGLMRDLANQRDTSRLGHLLSILGLIATAPPQQCTALSRQPVRVSGVPHHQQAISRAVHHLTTHFREDVKLEKLLHLTAMSRPTFSRQFKQHNGRSFSEFLVQLRLQAACRELKETSQTILEIALGCGFTQISFFNRIFRREMAVSPRDYRKNHENAFAPAR